MPYGVYKIENKFCVYKKSEKGNKKIGESLGCHDNRQSANSQLKALYSMERAIFRAEGYKPTEGMKIAAKRALEWRREFGRGGTAVGIARARDIVNNKNLSPSTVKRMFSFFSRHEVDKQASGFSAGEEGYPSNGRIAWDLWGGDSGFSWSRQISQSLKNKERNFFIVETSYILRDYNLNEIISQLETFLNESSLDEPKLMDFVYSEEEENYYFIVANEGSLYKIYYSIEDERFYFSVPESIDFRINKVVRENNKLLFYGIAGAATLNRMGEIDTIELYDNLVKRFKKGKEVNFYHTKHEKFILGEVLALERYKEFLVVVGEIDCTTPLGQYAERAIESNEWGFSIEFYPLKYETERIAGTQILKFIDGIFDGIAILLSKDAASYKTKLKGTN